MNQRRWWSLLTSTNPRRSLRRRPHIPLDDQEGYTADMQALRNDLSTVMRDLMRALDAYKQKKKKGRK